MLWLESLETRNLLAADPLPVLMVLADQQDFYYMEYSDTRLSIEAAGVDVAVAATTTSPTTAHANTGQGAETGIVVPDIALVDVNPEDYSAIVFVGGWGASMYQYAFDAGGNFYQNDHYNGDVATKQIVNDLINEFIAADKHIAAICHGVSVLAWARVDGVSPLSGRQVSVPFVGTPAMFYDGVWYPNFYAQGQYDQAIANGALPNLVSGQYGDPTTVADDVIVDGRIITAENYDSALHFGQVIAQEVLAVANEELPPPVGWSGSDVLVQGTPEADTIYVWSGAVAHEVYVWLNGEMFGPFLLPEGGWVVVHGGDGNDQIFASDLAVGAVINAGGGHDQMTGGKASDIIDGGAGVDRVWGGPGDDLIRGGEGNDVLLGREGNDILVGGAGKDWIDGFIGHDLLIGGSGGDQLNGGEGVDILIGGTTSHDEADDALLAIQAAWTSETELAARIALLSNDLVWGDSVLDDGETDALVGGLGADWIFSILGEALWANPDDVMTAA